MRKLLILSALLPLSLFPVSAKEQPDTTRLPEFVISETPKVKIELVPLTVNIVTAAQIEKTAASSLLPVLESRVPGMFVAQRGFGGFGVSGGAAGQVNIRGIGGGTEVLFLVDGQPQFAGMFGHSVSDTYNANGVQRVEVVKGPSSFLYGTNAMGGSVNIITKRPTREGFHAHARALFGSFSTQRFNAGADMKEGDFTASVTASLDRSNSNRRGGSYWLADERMQFGWQHDDKWSVGANVNLNQGFLNNPGTLQKPLESMWTDIRRGMASVSVKDNFGFANGGLQLFSSWGKHKVDDGFNPATEQPKDNLFNSTDYNMGFTLYQTFNPWQDNDLSAGVDFQHWGGHNWNTMKADGSIKPGSKVWHHVNEIGVYAMMQQQLFSDFLSLNAGIRYQHGSNYGDQWIPQAGFILRPWDGGMLKFNFSKGFRAPNIKELYLFMSSDPNLLPEDMYNYEIECRQHLLENRLNIGIALFFIDANNIIQLIKRSDSGRYRFVNTGKLINKGFEVDASYQILDNLSVFANYAYLHTSKAVISAPKNKVDAGITWAPESFEFTLESNTVGALITDIDQLTKSSYSLLNFRGSWKTPGKNPIRLFVELDNLTNRHYEILLGCPMPGFTILGGLEFHF